MWDREGTSYTVRPMRIGILGGTGPAGRALAVRLASVGFDTVVGSRSAERAAEICQGLLAEWPDHELPLSGAANPGAAACDVVVVATPWDAAASTAASVADELAGKVVISMANALAKMGREFQPLVPSRGSIAAAVQAAVPQALVSGALHHVPAHDLGNLNQPVDCDVLVCSDHPEATATTMEVMDKLPGVRSLDAGALSYASPVETFTAVLLQLNVRYKTRVAVRFTGLGLEGG
ncbi:MAG: NADPH-dependent F420 reductase [Acidimicrobiia bacterium]|nr:NADPH-dependent F420 reductase [Acidimicrobiia bacterium]MYB74887.1 NADPH-dependent F420 reductase [Acidimicrobiia bacterium]MYI00767.1 NADPH-dependent F420 reductase [Acidimicrobiia bacterium]